jgi:hypothetical protein
VPPDGMTIRLHLRRVRGVWVVEDEFDKLVIEVADTRRVWCPACAYQTSKVPETCRVEIRDLPRAGRHRWCGCSGASSAPIWVAAHRGPSRDRGQGHPAFDPMAGAGLEIPHDPGAVARHRLSWHLTMRRARSWPAVVEARRRARAGDGCC